MSSIRVTRISVILFLNQREKKGNVMKDTEIIALYWERDERALAETADAYGHYCYSIAYHILHIREDSEECVNDTWLRAWDAIPPARPNYLNLFLGTITRNLSFDRWKRRQAAKRGGGQTELVIEELEECIPTVHTTEEAVDEAELQRMLNDFLGTLRERERQVFLRRYWYAWECGEIARYYDMKPNTVKTTLFRLRGRLREYLEREGAIL